MFLTKERDYAVRAVRALADMEKKSVKEICKLEHMPIDFTYKILKKLEQGGIVKPSRGSRGGYSLATEPKNISLLDILFAIDEKMFINECLKPGAICKNHNAEKRCLVHEALEQLQGDVINVLKTKTMDQLI